MVFHRAFLVGLLGDLFSVQWALFPHGNAENIQDEIYSGRGLENKMTQQGANISWEYFLKKSIFHVISERFYFIDSEGEVEENDVAAFFRQSFIRNFLNEGLGEVPQELGMRFDNALPVITEASGLPEVHPMWADQRFIAAPIATLAVLFDRISTPGFQANIQIRTEEDDRAVFGRRLASITLRDAGEEQEKKAAAMIHAAAGAFLMEEAAMLLGVYLMLEGKHEQ